MTTTQQPENRTLPVPVGVSQLPVAAGETASSAIAARERASVEARFLVAMNRPRNFDAAFARLMTACKRPTFAKVARYSKPVGGKHVHGLSIRFAEEALNLWGNCDVSAFVVFDDDERRVYRIQGTDLETNTTHSTDVLIEKFVERRSPKQGDEVIGEPRMNSQGELVYKLRANEDALITKINNHIAKGRRNVILPLIPGDVKDECTKQILATMADRDAKDPEGARKDIVLAFHSMGVAATQLVELLGHPLESVNPAELTLLRSYYTALNDGEATWNEIVEAHSGRKAPAENSGERPKGGTEGLRESLAGKAKAAPVTESPEKAAPKGAAPAAAADPKAKGIVLQDICSECSQKKGAQHLATCWFKMHPEEEKA